MRNRSPTLPFYAYSASFNPDQAPIAVSEAIMDRWCYLVKDWAFGIDIVLHPASGPDVPLVLNGVFGWNYNNTLFVNPETGDAPTNEQWLGFGYQIRNANFDNTGFSLTNGQFSLFESSLGNLAAPGYGYWNDSGATRPYLYISAGRCQSLIGGTSLVTCTIDGIPVPMMDVVGGYYTGTVILTPSTFWPYRLAGGGNPMYNASGTPILPRQTDELP